MREERFALRYSQEHNKRADMNSYPTMGPWSILFGPDLESQMAAPRTPEQCAHAILAIFVSHFGLRPNEVLPRRSFLTIWPQRGYRPKDFKAGLQFATESGWLEPLPGGKALRLTKSGFTDG